MELQSHKAWWTSHWLPCFNNKKGPLNPAHHILYLDKALIGHPYNKQAFSQLKGLDLNWEDVWWSEVLPFLRFRIITHFPFFSPNIILLNFTNYLQIKYIVSYIDSPSPQYFYSNYFLPHSVSNSHLLPKSLWYNYFIIFLLLFLFQILPSISFLCNAFPNSPSIFFSKWWTTDYFPQTDNIHIN